MSTKIKVYGGPIPKVEIIEIIDRSPSLYYVSSSKFETYEPTETSLKRSRRIPHKELY